MIIFANDALVSTLKFVHIFLKKPIEAYIHCSKELDWETTWNNILKNAEMIRNKCTIALFLKFKKCFEAGYLISRNLFWLHVSYCCSLKGTIV